MANTPYPGGGYQCADEAGARLEFKLHLNPQNAYGYHMTYADLSVVWEQLAEILTTRIFEDNGIPFFDLVMSKHIPNTVKRQANPPLDRILAGGTFDIVGRSASGSNNTTVESIKDGSVYQISTQ